MLAFICLFFPAMLSLRILEKLGREELRPLQRVYNYCTYVLLINFVCLGTKTLVLRTANIPLYEGGDMLPSAAFIYLIMAMFSGVFFAVLQVLLRKKVSFSVEEDKNAF